MPYYIREWDCLVHYRSRNAPWIKLYKNIMHAPWWIRSTSTMKLVAITLLVTSDQSTGKVLVEPKDVKVLAQLKKIPDFKSLIDVGFLVDDASKMLATCYHDASTIREEKRIYKRREEENPVVHKHNGSSKPAWWGSESATILKASELQIAARPGESWSELRDRVNAEIANRKLNS